MHKRLLRVQIPPARRDRGQGVLPAGAREDQAHGAADPAARDDRRPAAATQRDGDDRQVRDHGRRAR